jgi:hypothetical protein
MFRLLHPQFPQGRICCLTIEGQKDPIGVLSHLASGASGFCKAPNWGLYTPSNVLTCLQTSILNETCLLLENSQVASSQHAK